MAGRSPRWCGDLGVAYANRCAGQAPGWAPLAVQYVDYTLWQRAQLGELGDSDSPIAGQLAYWEQALAGMPERLALPTNRPYPPVADYRGAGVAVNWPAELQQRVRGVAREHNATSFMVMQAALAVLLAKVSASPEVAIGFPIAGRRDPALDELVGLFVEHLGVAGRSGRGSPRRRAAGPGAPAQPGRLRASRRALRGAGGAAGPPTRSLTRHPLVQVVLGWQNLPGQTSDPAAGLALGDLRVTQLSADTRTARMDLVSSLAERRARPVSRPGSAGRWSFAPTCSTRPASRR